MNNVLGHDSTQLGETAPETTWAYETVMLLVMDVTILRIFPKNNLKYQVQFTVIKAYV